MSATNSTFPPGYLDEYIGFKLVWLSSAFIAIDIFFVGLRYYARYVSRTSIGADDYLTLCSLVCAIALSAIGICEWFLPLFSYLNPKKKKKNQSDFFGKF